MDAEPGLDVTQALGERYLMVDWGLAHALEHRRLFPDAPEPVVRVSNGSMALAYIRELGGAAYLPYTTVEADLSAEELFLVAEAPSITRHAYAVYLTRSTKLPLIRTALEAIDPPLVETNPADPVVQQNLLHGEGDPNLPQYQQGKTQ